MTAVADTLDSETLEQLLDTIRRLGPIARIDISEHTELSTTTVSAITASLLDDGLISPRPEGDLRNAATRGRPRVMLELAPDAACVIGAKIMPNCLVFALTDFRGDVISTLSLPVRVDRQPIAVIADLIEDGAGSHLLGVARLPDGSQVACGSCIIREVDDGSDWLDFYLPMGSLSRTTYPVGGFPFDTYTEQSAPWQREVEDWLAHIGLHIARHVTYALGLIGFEVSGQVYASEIAAKGIPEKRNIGYLWPAAGRMFYFPRTA